MMIPISIHSHCQRKLQPLDQISRKHGKIRYCNEFREILRLPQNIRHVEVVNCHSLDSQSFFQFREIIGLSPNLPPCLGVTSHMLMGPHSSTTRSLASETPLSEYKFVVTVDENEIPNWFNHQRDGNLISFSIGPEFPTIALCVALKIPDSTCYCNYHVIISINGSVRTFENILIEEDMRTEHLFFSCRPQSSLQDLFGDLNLGDRNHVELFCETFTLDCSSSGEITPIIKRIGVYVECICPPPKNGSDSGLAFDSSNVDGLDLG